MDERRRPAVMLRGHESLLRLVGKRRKLHPSVFLVPDSEDTHHPDGKIDQESPPAGNENGVLEWVSCPVCSKSIQGNDAVINIHLDSCLVKGSKRKTTQLTLFSSMKRVTNGATKGKGPIEKMPSVVSNGAGLDPESGSQFSESTVSKFSCVDDAEDFQEIVVFDSGNNHCDVNLDGSVLPPAETSAVGVRREELVSDDSNERVLCPLRNAAIVKQEVMTSVVKPEIDIDERFDSVRDVKLEEFELTQRDYVKFEELCICTCHFAPAKSCRGDTPESVQTAAPRESLLGAKEDKASVHILGTVQEEVLRDSSVVVGDLNTRIVGRKFSLEAVCEGMQVAFVRDAGNPKDSNAVKVVTLDKLELGYLPRLVSVHLSVFLDKQLGNLKGFVLTVPEDVFEAVPINVILEKKHLEPVDEESFSKCWQGALTASLVPPKQFKYEANFLCLLQSVLERDSPLFNSDEQAFLSSFKLLSGDAQRLFIHLYQRKGPWFRVKQLNYSDVGDMDSSCQALTGAGYMISSEATGDSDGNEFRELVEVLSAFELRQMVLSAQLKDRREVAVARKEELVYWVASGVFDNDQVSALGGCSGTVLRDKLLDLLGPCVRVSDEASFLLWRSQRLFFLNGDQDLSSFLLVDMGRVKYPDYTCNRKTPVFASRKDLLEYEKALEVAQAMDMALELNDMANVMSFTARARAFLRFNQREASNEPPSDERPSFLFRFTAARVYATICTLSVSILERERRYAEAVELLKELLSTCIRSGRRGYWTVRLSTDLDHLGRKEESLQVAEKGVSDPLIRGGDLVALQRRVVRLSKPPRRWRKPPYSEALDLKVEEVQVRGRPLNSTIGMKSRFYGFDGQQCGVEELALQYFASEEGGGWQGMHSEGGVWMMLFSLLMWEILFADVPDVFQTQFQTAPLDLDSRSFYTTRRSMIEARLDEIHQGSAVALLADCWSKHHGTFCRGANWERYSLETLQTVAACVGGSGLSALFRLLTQDHAGYSAGMPDLLLWRTFRKPTFSRRANSDRNCPSCDCDQEVDTSDSSKAEDTEGTVEVEGYVIRGEAKLVEVKGPRDRLSEQQRAWIVSLLNAGLVVQVCKVLETVDC